MAELVLFNGSDACTVKKRNASGRNKVLTAVKGHFIKDKTQNEEIRKK